MPLSTTVLQRCCRKRAFANGLSKPPFSDELMVTYIAIATVGDNVQ